MSKILLIDSGIDNISQNQNLTILGGKNFLKGEDANNISDLNGHGTYCASVITRNCPFAEFIFAKVLDKSANACSAALVEALEYASQLDIQIVNISLATLDYKYKYDMQKLCKKLYNQGIIVISSVANRQANSLPASLDGVIGVDGIFMNDSLNYWYYKNIPIQCVADLTPVMVNDFGNSYRMFGGNSKATSVITSLVSRMLNDNENMSIEDVLNKLSQNAIVSQWEQSDIENGKELPNFNNNIAINNLNQDKKTEIIESILLEYFQASEEDRNWLYSNYLHYFLKPKDYYYILLNIENKLNLTLNYSEIKFEAFHSVKTLTNTIFKDDLDVQAKNRKKFGILD